MNKEENMKNSTELNLINEENFVKVNFCIPSLGTEIILAEPWTFDLYDENRNRTLIKSLDLDKELKCDWYSDSRKKKSVTIPRGSKLSISRIYIRNGQKDYDSVTFYLKKYRGNSKIKGRFWAKLHDVNKMVCFPIGKEVDTESIFDAFKKPKDKFFNIEDEL